MRLKKIRLAGFKSFVDPTNIPFPGDMTAIVGPNGCGKSNVIDAVRWVLGESSAKNLRGDSMTDVIFNGSSARKAVSQCSVELVFDNSSGRIQGEFAAFNEISVKRIVTQEALSSYWLNGTKCRRRDITDLFLGTGLGPRSYAIIEQGMISKLIESRPQDLRVFIEEAAGISKYKERRKETITRISHTKENLERLEDVRQELGDQLAKLKRQATAAIKYKELKQSERRLKSELATTRWLTQSKLMQQVQEQINEKQMALESLLSGQQGDESGLQALKNNQSIVKQEIDDQQQGLFTLGTEITKLEQSQLFAKKRSVQIQAEIDQIKQSESSLLLAVQSISAELSLTQDKILSTEPDKEILQEQLLEVEDRKIVIDDKLRTLLSTNKNKEDVFHNKKRELQQKHGQIQQTLSSQERTQIRISELQSEITEIEDERVKLELREIESQSLAAKNQVLLLEIEYANYSRSHAQAKQEQSRLNTEQDASNQAVISTQAKLDALLAMQHESPGNEFVDGVLHDFLQNGSQNIENTPIWQFFQIEPGYEQALHSALREFDGGLVIDTTYPNESENWHKSKPVTLMFAQEFTRTKTKGTLSELLTNQWVPDSFNAILIAETDSEAIVLREQISSAQKVISKNGIVYTKDAYIAPNQSDNKLARAVQIDSLQGLLSEQQRMLDDAKLAVKRSELMLKEQYQLVENAREELAQSKNDLNHLQMSKKNLEFKVEQFAQRNSKIKAELQNQQERLLQEDMSLELLNEHLEDLAIEVAQLEELRDISMTENEQLQLQQQTIQIQYNQMQNQLHQHALASQQLQNSLQLLQEQAQSKHAILETNQDKLAVLQDEAEDLLMPEHDQQAKLQIMLEQQSALRTALQDKQEILSGIEQDIIDLEKGQHGLNSKMDAIKSEIESLRIRYESANVRAQSHIEHLAELDQSVKDILATLPENADEATWQSELDSVSASISRLGAVNLAAVDEYEEQAVRKQHLDDQNKDLTDALDTLESAMRKIDKETRSRFKHTYDQVNSDLKTLFPKVFGGGSAYLELTGEDLLETGVTIMARPPGKKNSTIHLLSGGEKALTALSLVFAIFRLNPAPFCLLDEVDAPLDDANVGRFCRLVSEMSQSVQFIYITHNKVAMEMATHLTGVTMAEPGVSRMVAVDMEQALAIAE